MIKRFVIVKICNDSIYRYFDKFNPKKAKTLGRDYQWHIHPRAAKKFQHESDCIEIINSLSEQGKNYYSILPVWLNSEIHE